MSMFESFKTDVDLEKNGIILNYESEGFRVTIGRAGGANKKYEKVMERISKPHKRALQTDRLNNETAKKILMEAYAEAIVFKWEVVDEDGKWQVGIESQSGGIIPFNKENVHETFKILPGLFADIQAQAEKENLFLASIKEANAKN